MTIHYKNHYHNITAYFIIYRSKNTVNILIKNWLDMCIGALVYWAVGFGLTFGNSPPLLAPFMGSSYFFFFNMPGKSNLTLNEPDSNRFQRIIRNKRYILSNIYQKKVLDECYNGFAFLKI